MSSWLDIDGSQGEGGGQILRSSLALAMLTGRQVRLWAIRAQRSKPGLQRQHLAAVKAAAKVCDGELRGAELGSRELRFTPGTIRGGDYRFAIGTAGSTTLVLQTVLPALLLADRPSTLTLEGGTHNPLAPPVDFFTQSFAPLIERMGPRVDVRLVRHGFYPRGGGQVVARIEPVRKLVPLVLTERGEIVRRCARAVVAGLSRDIALRELAVVAERLGWTDHEQEAVVLPAQEGPGNYLTLTVRAEHVTETCTGFGQRGVRGEQVAAGAAAEVERYLAANVPVGEHLADQLLLPLALAGSGEFTTLPPSLHATTNIGIIEQFLPVRFDTEELSPTQTLIRVTSASDKS